MFLKYVFEMSGKIKDTTIRSKLQGTQCYADVIYLPPLQGIEKGERALWDSELILHQLGCPPTVHLPRWTTQLCILYQGAAVHPSTNLLLVTETAFYATIKEISGPGQIPVAPCHGQDCACLTQIIVSLSKRAIGDNTFY